MVMIFDPVSNVIKYINVIDRNFVTRQNGKRKLHESTLAAAQLTEPKIVQKFADKEDEALMSQCDKLFSKQNDGWHINNFWFVKPFIYWRLNKHDKQIEALMAKMFESAKENPGRISIKEI